MSVQYLIFSPFILQQVSDKNHQITMLEEENDALLEQLDELQQHS